MKNNKFRFLLMSGKTAEIKEYFTEAMTFNEAISDAHVRCHNLRGNSSNTWEIVSATDEKCRKTGLLDTFTVLDKQITMSHKQ